MDNSTYLALETMSSVILLILLYANNFEVKEHTRKRRLFNILLIINTIIAIADAITFIPFAWIRFPFLMGALVTVTYTFTSVMKLFFASYLYEHISAKAPVDTKPFKYLRYFYIVEFVAVFLMCISEKLFYIRDYEYFVGPLFPLYLVLTLLSVLLLIIIVVWNAKKLGVHGTVAVLPFCLIPLFSVAVLELLGINLSITMLSITMLLVFITIQSEHESNLFKRVNIDELTGLYNRAAYEEEIHRFLNTPDDSLVYASADLNGLKAANDNLGHDAGDELIRGAADCLKQAFGGAGKVFRIGGDEFAAIFLVDEYNYKFDVLKGALGVLVKNWKGRHVDGLTLSVGYVMQKEFPDESIVGLAKIADKRMYAEKSKFYTRNGVDRRGQNNAYKALSSLYTKILKINITEDSYTIVDMFSDEQSEEKGFAESISEWLIGFGKSGLVHPDDLENYLSKTSMEYMRDHFKNGKTYLMVTYRRKYGDEFKRAIMEIIPASDYANDSQSLYLYVKKVE